MDDEQIGRIKLLFKRVNRDLERDISLDKINEFTDELEDIKDALSAQGYDWIDEFKPIEYLDEDVVDEDIEDALNECHEQLERILARLGIDAEEVVNPKSVQYAPPQSAIITINQIQAQNQNLSSNVNILLEEFKKESTQPNPNKSKMRKILDKLREEGQEHIVDVLSAILNNIDKLNFGR